MFFLRKGKKKIKIVLFLLVVMIILFVSSSISVGAEKIKITVSIGSHGRFLLKDTIKAFESEYPNIKVEPLAISSVPNEAFQVYSTAFAAKDGSINILGLDPSWPAYMARAGWIEPLDNLLSQEDMEEVKRDFNKEALEINTIKGKLYAIPLYADALLFYYRKDLLNKCGFEPPQTWGDLEKQVTSILSAEDDPNLSGYIYQAARIEGIVCNYVNFLSGTGGKILDENGKVLLESPESLEALRFMTYMMKKGITPSTIVTHNPHDDAIQFQNGQAIFMNNWPFAMGMFQKEGSPMKNKVGISRMPGKYGPAASCIGGVSLAINHYSKNKDAALKFVRFITNYEWNKQRAIRSSLLPARTMVYEDPEVLSANPSFNEIKKGAKYLTSRPKTEKYLEISYVLQLHLNQALLSIETPEEALHRAAEKIREILSE